jgi:predicted acyl esterase
VADARGTGASFGTRTGELGEREITDYGELIDWIAAQPWSNGRVRVYGPSPVRRASRGSREPMGLTVQLLPVSAVVPAGHRVRVAIAGHDASSFTRYGPAEETFTHRLGSDSHLDLPVRCR